MSERKTLTTDEALRAMGLASERSEVIIPLDLPRLNRFQRWRSRRAFLRETLRLCREPLNP